VKPGCPVIVIGAGSTGAAVAHDLALRGFSVTLVERFGVAGGTTGHNQAQLHSGARYAVKDPASARECIDDNRVLRRIMPEALELNDGLFIALSEQHLAYREPFLEACAQCGIPTRELSVKEALRLEPGLNPGLLAAIQIPDGVFDPYRFTLSFLATARKNGARVLLFHEVIGLDPQKGEVVVLERPTGKRLTLGCDAVINTAGPWAPEIAQMANVHLEVEASAGVMATVKKRLCNMVVNLLDYPADGDIIVPQRQASILGTTSWSVSDPDQIPIPPEHLARLVELGDWMIPGVKRTPLLGVMAAARPLIKFQGGAGRDATRSHLCFDHSAPGSAAFFSIIGGKTTTARLMAEQLVDKLCARMGVQAECRTRTESLESYRLGL
jgi:glycerol-3-phosphate dehydrogenase